MIRNDDERRRYLGMRPGDLDGKPYAHFWNPRMAPLSAQAREAIACGPVAAPLLPPLADASKFIEQSEAPLENGYALAENGALHVAIRTEMPGTSPAMVDWWFGWHSDEPERYKLWHPHAHVHAAWGSPVCDGTRGRGRYVGAVSHVDEYLGSALGQFAIRFIRPKELGLDENLLVDPEQATAICARIGFAKFPLDAGYLLHHVRRIPGGSEMRSRFWIGGPYADTRRGGIAVKPLARLAAFFRKPKPSDGHELLVHCAQEMAHLASFLPRLFHELGEKL